MATAKYIKGEKCSVEYLAAADIVVDQVVVAGANSPACVGVASNAIASGVVGIIDIAGVYEFPKVSGAVIKAGEAVDWDVSAGEVDDNQATSASGDVSDFGVALEDAGSGVTTIKAKLTPGVGVLN